MTAVALLPERGSCRRLAAPPPTVGPLFVTGAGSSLGFLDVERATTELSKLADPDLFEESAAGIGHVLESVDELDAAARRLLQTGNPHRPSMYGSFPAEVLGNLAEEEAAKALILLDAVRCPRARQQEMARTLGYFYDHIAKGLYVEACRWRFVELNDVAQRIEVERVQHYLDGPNGVDFIVPNDVIWRRESALYVDYVRDDSEGSGPGACFWTTPPKEPLVSRFTPAVIEVARALHRAGVTSAPSLAVVAEIWRPVELRPEMSVRELMRLNQQTLETLHGKGLLAAAPDDVYEVVAGKWLFPLWPLDLRVRKVKKQDLREVRRSTWPECW